MGLDQFTDEEARALRAGAAIRVGNCVYRICGRCGKVVQWNKPVLGSLHICADPEECLDTDEYRD